MKKTIPTSQFRSAEINTIAQFLVSVSGRSFCAGSTMHNLTTNNSVKPHDYAVSKWRYRTLKQLMEDCFLSCWQSGI